MRLIPCTGERFMVAGGGRFLLSQVQDAAQLLREGYAQQVQLIYLDPPFGTGTSFYAKVPGGQAPVGARLYGSHGAGGISFHDGGDAGPVL